MSVGCIVVALSALLLTGSALAAKRIPMESYATPAQLVTLPDSRRMNLFCLGSGSPTVVLDAGWGLDIRTWAGIHAILAETTQVCAFDRAGMGFSDVGPIPRDTRAIVADQHALMKSAGIPGPYILVGHSLAGLNVRLYASLHREDVAGIVLIDPANPYQDRRLAAVAPRAKAAEDTETAKARRCSERVIAGEFTSSDPEFAACFPPLPATLPDAFRMVILARQSNPGFHRTLWSEFDSFSGPNSEIIDTSLRSFGDLPLLVLTAEGTDQNADILPAEEAAMTKVWKQMHEEAAALSTRGENRLITAGHYIHEDKPEVVVDAINEVVAAARTVQRGLAPSGFIDPLSPAQ